MIKLLVSSDDYVYSYNGEYYFREFGLILIQRYLVGFDKIKFVARTKYVNSKEELGVYNIKLSLDQIEIFPVPFFQGPIGYLRNYIKIKKTMRHSIDMCNAAILRIPSTTAFNVYKYIKKIKMPYAVEVVANPKDLYKNAKTLIAKLSMLIMHYKQKSICRNADGASYVTKKALQKYYPAEKYNHFESNYSSVELSGEFIKKPRNKCNLRPFIICHVAHPIKTFNKGHLTVIDTVKKMTVKGYDVIAMFAGDGEYISYFKKYANKIGVLNRIYFVGFLEKYDLIKFYEKADVMLLPTESEGLPRVLLEASSTGLPCLSTPISGIPEIVHEDLIFKSNDSSGFSEKIMEIIDLENQYKKYSQYAYEKSLQYLPNILKKRRDEFYIKLLGRVI